MSIKTNLAYLKNLEKRLTDAGIASASYEAEWLITHYGRIERMDFFTGKKGLTAAARRAVEKAVKERTEGRALQHILKTAPFYGIDFYVTPDALIPRPETELLIEEGAAVLETCTSRPPQVLDLGTGSGCLAVCLTIQCPACKMTASDTSSKALAIARKNIENNGLSKKIQLVSGDLFRPFGQKYKGFWDLIVSNPPYIPEAEIPALSPEVRSEPHLALSGGADGLDVIRRILAEAPYFLKAGGWLLMEIGKGQSRTLRKEIQAMPDYKNLRFIKDLAGIERVIAVQKIS